MYKIIDRYTQLSMASLFGFYCQSVLQLYHHVYVSRYWDEPHPAIAIATTTKRKKRCYIDNGLIWEGGTKITRVGQYSLVNIVLGGHYSLVNIVPGTLFTGEFCPWGQTVGGTRHTMTTSFTRSGKVITRTKCAKAGCQ
jgi:hypothetical protein